MRSMPAARARPTTPSRSSAKSGKSRWQWLSTSMCLYCLRRLLLGLDIAREHRRGRRQRRARRDTMRAAETREDALVLRDRQQIEQFCRRRRHERQRQNADLAQHFGGHVEHGALPRRIGLGERPRRLAGKIAIGFGDHGPHRVEHVMQLLRRHGLARLADHGVGGGEDRLVVGAERARLRQRAAELLADHGQRALRQIAEIVGRDRH